MADLTKLLKKLQTKGFKLCSALWTDNSNNVYLAYIAIKDPSKWESHKPFGGKGLYGLFYCFAGDESEFRNLAPDVDTAALEKGADKIAKKYALDDMKSEFEDLTFRFSFKDADGKSHTLAYEALSTDVQDSAGFPQDVLDSLCDLAEKVGGCQDQFLGAPEEVDIDEIIDASLSAGSKLPARIESILDGSAASSCNLRSDQGK